jgi:hypothetical protein
MKGAEIFMNAFAVDLGKCFAEFPGSLARNALNYYKDRITIQVARRENSPH